MPSRLSSVARTLPVLLALGTAACLFAAPNAAPLVSLGGPPSASASPSGSASPSATAFPTQGDMLLPDLGMAPLRKFSIDTTVPGQTRLRFTTVVINIGDGAFRAFGHTKQASGDLLVDQQIASEDGTWTTAQSDFRMYFAGDEHNHWHLRDLETYDLQNGAATLKRVSEKHGFCFFDDAGFNLALPHAPASGVYARTGCGKAADLSITMGLSVGWKDIYLHRLPDQYIDITGLPSGEYTLTATADAQGFLHERCENNNSTAAVLLITGAEVSVVDPGEPSEACVR